MTKSVSLHPAREEIIAKFGPVHLIRLADGRHTLSGGTASERSKARKWCSEHAPFVAFELPQSPALAMAA